MNGKLLILQYKYGNKKDIFNSYEETIKLIEQYPIVFSIVPEQLKDKNMVLTFIKANGKFVKRFKDIQNEILKRDEEKRKNGVYTSVSGMHADIFAIEQEIKNNAFVDTLFDLGEFAKDVDVLVCAMENSCYGLWFVNTVGLFKLEPQHYDEKTIIKVIKRFPQIVTRVYCYWDSYIKNFPKEKEKVRVKDELRNDPADEELALFKTLSLIDVDNIEAIAHLISTYQIWGINNCGENLDHTDIIKNLFATYDIETQNKLVQNYFGQARYLKNGVLDADLEQHIAKHCPIAGDILSDEAILKYNLMPSDSDEESLQKCKECSACFLSRMVLI